MPEKRVGKVEHYYPKAKAVAIGLTDDLKVGDDVHIVGHGDDVRTKVKSLQLDHVPIAAAHAGQHVGVGLDARVHEGDDVLVRAAGIARAATKPRKPGAKAAIRKPSKAARKPAVRKAGKKSARRAGAKAKPKSRKAAARKSPRPKPRKGSARKLARKARPNARKAAGRRAASKRAPRRR